MSLLLAIIFNKDFIQIVKLSHRIKLSITYKFFLISVMCEFNDRFVSDLINDNNNEFSIKLNKTFIYNLNRCR